MSQKDLDEVHELVNVSKVLNLKTRVEILRFINKRIPVDYSKLDWKRTYYIRCMFANVGIYNLLWKFKQIEGARIEVLNL